MANSIVELEKFLVYCDERYRNLHPCRCGLKCTNNHFCSEESLNCYDCIKRVHDYRNSTVHYNCSKMLYYYVLKHGYRFSAEVFYLLQRLQRELIHKEDLYVTSIGCGPCTELFGALFYWRSIGKKNSSFHYRGFDLEAIWEPLMGVIPQFFSGADIHIDNKDALEYYLTIDEKVDVLILNYMLSDMLKFHSHAYPPFLESLCEMIKKVRPRYLLINDIYLLVSKNAVDQLIECMSQKGISFKYVKMQYPGNNSFIGEYGRHINRQPFEMPNEAVVAMYDPFSYVNSIQTIVVFQ